MKRKQLRLRRWLVVAFAVAALGYPAAAQAVLTDEAGSVNVQPGSPLVTTAGGFDWSDALIGAGVAAGVALSGLGIMRSGRLHRRVATS